MILTLRSDQLRALADQLDAHTALERAGADHMPHHSVLTVWAKPLAYLHWWQDEECYLAQFTSFTPGSATPLPYHDETPR